MRTYGSSLRIPIPRPFGFLSAESKFIRKDDGFLPRDLVISAGEMPEVSDQL